MKSARTILILRRIAIALLVALLGVACWLWVSHSKSRELGTPLPAPQRVEPVFGAATAPTDAGGFRPEYVVEEQSAITEFKILPANEIGEQVEDDELVVGVVVGGQPRAYTINTMTGPAREIFNDTLGGRPIAATW